MKRALVAAVILGAPALAAAQAPNYYPSAQVPSAPVDLDPGATGSQAPPAAPPPSSRPNVMVVGPDGSVKYAPDQGTGSGSGYYVDSGPGGTYDEPGTIHAGPTPELHVVRSGDTLWDICFYYFNDPWQWPKIWSYNPQITNPHWIYPGDLVRLLPRGVFASEPEVGTPTPPETNPSPDTVPPPAKNISVGLRQAAFVEQSDLDRSIKITGSVDEKVLLGIGDQVYLSYPAGKPPEVGKTYSIYVPDNPVKGYGAYVHILGELKVVSVQEDKLARGEITAADQEIERGAYVGPLVKEFKTVPPVAPSVDLQGTIVALLANAQLIGQGELVFIDKGKDSGLQVGNRMFVVRRGDAYAAKNNNTVGQDDQRFPARALGEVVIVEVGDKISVGLITLAVQEMGVGDQVLMQKK
ncbi:MAG TPA: LysM peptidoglycan-binding domain-containing protein [Kofleriaceae bacterium]|nr:LysM peptidoglycan-binding domain-containing protein [Kofleriaceae bacterium]